MMTATTEPRRVLRDAQRLIDARLDTIDRMLIGRLPRADRLSITRDVELQVHELLQERDTEELTREDVIAVLSQLDPPEAYIPEGVTEAGGSLPVRLAAVGSLQPVRSQPQSRLGKISGMLGILSLVVVVISPVTYLLALLFESEIILFAGFFVVGGVAFVLGLLSLIFAIRARLHDAWSVTGLVTACLGLLGAVFIGGYLAFMLVLIMSNG
jgi:hypothetical protein